MTTGAVSEFWRWFDEQSTVLSFLCSSGDSAQLHSLIDEQLAKIGSGVRWEIGRGYRSKYRFSIAQRPTEELALRLLGKAIIDSAPDRVKGWEFCLMVLGGPSEQEAKAPQAAVLEPNAPKKSTPAPAAKVAGAS